MSKDNKATLKYLFSISGKSKIIIILLTLIQILLGASSVLYALLLKNIINAAVDGNSSTFRYSAICFVLLVTGQIVFRALNRWLDELSKSTLENHFKSRLFSTILNREYAQVSTVHSGEWLNRLTSDTVIIANGLTNIIPGISGMAVKLISAAVMIMLLEPRFCYLIIPGGILLFMFSYMFRKHIKKLHKQVQKQDGKVRMFMQDIISSLLVVRSYAIEDETIHNADAKMKLHQKLRMKKNKFSNICNIGFGTVMNGASVLGAVFCGYGILTKTMSYGTFTAVLQLINQIQSPFANISGYLPQWYTMIASCERITAAERITEQSSRNSYSPDQIKKKYESLQALEMKNAGFTYLPPVKEPGAEQTVIPMPVVLKNINLIIKKGEYTAFTGQSGCGKSTVMKLFLSLYQLDQGEKNIICKGEKMPLDMKWQRLFAYVPQGNHLMSGTIREIVSLGCADQSMDDEKIENALKIACADDFVSELENGADTILGERGQGLSEGQMQRIALARAIFSERPILLLDESTSALDEQTEKTVLANLRKMTDKTVIIVTHRPAALEICNRIFEFTESGITERIYKNGTKV